MKKMLATLATTAVVGVAAVAAPAPAEARHFGPGLGFGLAAGALIAGAAAASAYGPYGYYDALNPTTGSIAHRYFVLDHSMIMAGLDNALENNAMQRHFAADPVGQAVQPYLAIEQFSIR